MICASGIDKQAPVIDVGGGASVLVDWLLAAGYRKPAVLDISGRALEHARQRLGAASAGVEWFEADITEFRAPHPFPLRARTVVPAGQDLAAVSVPGLTIAVAALFR